MTKNTLLSPWRRTFQWATTLLVVLLPWFQINGNSLLRVDIPSLSLYFFGQRLRIEELYLLLFFTLALVLLFLLATLVFGRVWCGWACPQTTLNDIAEWFSRKLGLKIRNNRLAGRLLPKLTAHAGYVLLAFLVAANLLWYFIEPLHFFTQLLSGELPIAAWLTLLIIFATVYLDLALIGRLMCSEFCPYGRIQTALVDPGTLTLHLPETEIGRCIECKSCVRVCPMEIDIREGYQVECINCGRCLDACRKVMTPRHEPGLIRYSFGLEGKGFRALLNPRLLLLTAATIGIFTILTVATLNRSAATLKISHSHLVAARVLENGQVATFFNAWVNNRQQEENSYDITVRQPTADKPFLVKGQTRHIAVAGGGNQRIDFVLISDQDNRHRTVEFILTNRQGEVVASATAEITGQK